MRLVIFSRTHWSEPHRIRQQLALLLKKDFDVLYVSPKTKDKYKGISVKGLRFNQCVFISKYTSLPVVNLINSFFLNRFVKRELREGDIIINFLPELMISYRGGNKVISVINDDFASMAPSITKKWMMALIQNMCNKSELTVYVSESLKKKYPAENSLVIHPWVDGLKSNVIEGKSGSKNIILYWGYLSNAIDFSIFENIAKQIQSKYTDMKLLIIGPVQNGVEVHLDRLLSSFDCVEYRTPRDLSDVETERVLFGLEPISKEFKNSEFVEFPNKSARLISYGIPLVYSGCELATYPFFIAYNDNLNELLIFISDQRDLINNSILNYLKINNSESVLLKLNERIRQLNYLF